MRHLDLRFWLAAGLGAVLLVTAQCASAPPAALPARTDASVLHDLSDIRTVVVLYMENRSFDMLYGSFPGAEGIPPADRILPQVDRDGSVLRELPPVWNGLTSRSIEPAIAEAETAHLANAPFTIDDPDGFNAALSVPTRDLVHRFYQNQMQINSGRNDRFAAYSDAGALAMGHYDGSNLPMRALAREFTLADHFFMGAFGGSFLNHIYLICACVPYYPNADTNPASPSIAVVDPDGVSLTLAPTSPASALDGPPKYVRDGNLTPDFYAVNTMEPPYQPSRNAPAPDGDPAFADPSKPTTLPPQTARTIGDLLSEKGVSWAWYGGAWQATLDRHHEPLEVEFTYHHQPFNYFSSLAPGTAARDEHLRDGGVAGQKFLEDIDAGRLPQVAFYKPQSSLNEHPGNTDVLSGDTHAAEIIDHLRRGPQWEHMLIVVTYDENGGEWDHVAPPKGDRWGPGTRIPAIIISPYARRGHVDHTIYDTASILRFLTRRFDLPTLPGIAMRDDAFLANGHVPPGDLTAALNMAR
ncbi:MAG: acid phosphatase [Acidobacteria bacterium SCN 69-37]|nr:MAG: acid phosphatase [Acidobacteria bacterium SCN 69-37]